MADPVDELAGLQPEERARLERFALAFERVDASRYPLFTEQSVPDAVADAQARALELLGERGRKQSVRAAVEAFVDEAARAYSRRMSLPDTFLLFQSLPDRAEDRVRFLATVERAVVGLILWEELEDDDRVALVGPWLSLIEAIV